MHAFTGAWPTPPVAWAERIVCMQGVMHRDIKASNIMALVQDGVLVELKIIDFGSAQLVVEDASNPLLVGTTFYKPPELILGYSGHRHELDIWEYGCCIVLLFSLGQLSLVLQAWCSLRECAAQFAYIWIHGGQTSCS